MFPGLLILKSHDDFILYHFQYLKEITSGDFFLIDRGFYLNDLGDYEYIGLIGLGKFGIIFSFLAVALLINAYNYTDGIDGLLLSLTITGLIYITLILKDTNDIFFLKLILIPLTINLFFNFLPTRSPFKVFMGDSGSLLLGFFISFLTIYLYTKKNIHPSFLIWISWYPIYDFLTVTISRLIKNKKIYKPDQFHLHHKIIRKYKISHIKTTIYISCLNVLIISFGYSSVIYFGKLFSLILFFVLFIIFYFIANNYLKIKN